VSHGKTHPTPTAEEIASAALNEQGYLFQHKIIRVLQSPTEAGSPKHEWYVEASEVPVSLPNGDETRVDIVLKHRYSQADNPWHVVMECKRAARDYKRWIFISNIKYAKGPWPNQYYTEYARLAGGWDSQGEPPMAHTVELTTADNECPAFDFGVEARIEPPTNRDKRASATDAIEDALHQVTLGQTGLANTLRRAHLLMIRLIPIVVTTAELMNAHFEDDKVSLEAGKIDPKDLRLEPRKWLAVNYRISDVISQFSGVNANLTTSIAQHLASRQVRTVFVVQAEHIQPFLEWLEKHFIGAARR
jgi:hypothetical protein